MSEGLSDDEIIFCRRMLPHYLAGKTVEEAAREVLLDDARIINFALQKSCGVWGGDIIGSVAGRTTDGEALLSLISGQVYRALADAA